MGCVLTPARGWNLLGAAALSVLAGLVLVFVAVTPERVGLLRTGELCGVLALLFLPGVTVWSLRRSRCTRLTDDQSVRPGVPPVSVQAQVSGVGRSRPTVAHPSDLPAEASDWQIIIPVHELMPELRRTPAGTTVKRTARGHHRRRSGTVIANAERTPASRE